MLELAWPLKKRRASWKGAAYERRFSVLGWTQGGPIGQR